MSLLTQTLTISLQAKRHKVPSDFMRASALFNGAFKATFSVAADGCRFINEQRKLWIRIKPSYSKVNGVKTRSITWGSNAHYRDKKIINPILRKLNEDLRNYEIPIDSWRTADPGHFHLYRLK